MKVVGCVGTGGGDRVGGAGKAGPTVVRCPRNKNLILRVSLDCLRIFYNTGDCHKTI